MASAVPEEVTERLTCAVCMEQFKEPLRFCHVCILTVKCAWGNW